MKFKFLFVFSILLSVNVWANSTVFVLNDNSSIRSTKSEIDASNILKTLNKDKSLQRLTMHYSGWSLVEVDNINGWILSSSLTDKAPVVSSNIPKIVDIKPLKKEVERLNSQLATVKKALDQAQLLNQQLTQKANISEASIEALSTENVALKQTLVQFSKPKDKTIKISKNAKDSALSPVEVGDSSESFLSVNWVYVGISALAAILLALLFFYNRNKHRHFDLNTLRR